MTGTIHALPVRAPTRLLTKRELARELGRSTRWIELRMTEGLPVQPRTDRRQHARYDLTEVRAWLDHRAGQPVPESMEQRVARLERTVVSLAAEIHDRRTA